MSKQIKISDGLVISREWLENHICNLQNKGATSRLGEVRDFATHDALIAVLKNSTPLAPVASEAFDAGVAIGCVRADIIAKGVAQVPKEISSKQEFLSGKIEINE